MLGMAATHIRRTYEKGIDGSLGLMGCGMDERCPFGLVGEYMLLWVTRSLYAMLSIFEYINWFCFVCYLILEGWESLPRWWYLWWLLADAELAT